VHKEGKERGNGKDLEGKRPRGLWLLIEAHRLKGEAEEARGKAVSRSAPASTEERRGPGGRRSADRWDCPVCDTRKKKKRGGRRAAAGERRWADGPLRAEREVRYFLFFSFSF
jgi:hypothetical protein